MRIIAQSDVERLLPVARCVDVMRHAMIATSNGNVTLPIRQFMPISGAPGKLALMPGTLGDPACFGIKLVCKYDRPHDDPLGTHVGMVLLFDTAKGVPLAMIEGSSLTAIRTSAASALATQIMAREDASRLAIIGNGEQAARHVDAMMAVRPIRQIDVWGRDRTRAQAFATATEARTGIPVTAHGSAKRAVAKADVICTTTAAKEPVLFGADLQEGQHINLVGAAIPTSAEVDSEAVRRARYVVDYRPAAMAAAGELLNAIESGVISADHITGEIGEIAAGSCEGRASPDEITMYKSLGVAAQDLASAHAIWSLAEAQKAGTEVDLLG